MMMKGANQKEVNKPKGANEPPVIRDYKIINYYYFVLFFLSKRKITRKKNILIVAGTCR
jgi:hypothetical protein